MPRPASVSYLPAVIVAGFAWAALAAAAALLCGLHAPTEDAGPGFLAAAWLAPLLAGVLAVSLFWSPFRALGFVPYATVLALIAFLLLPVFREWVAVPLGVVSFAAGAALAGLRQYATRFAPPRVAPWLARAFFPLIPAVAMLTVLARHSVSAETVRLVAVAVAGVGCVLAPFFLFRPAYELTSEVIVWVMYHVRGSGPGLTNFPTRGPAIVVANHACWLDPLFLAKVLPRPITPMMTSRFYDLPVLRSLMKVFGVIRVQEGGLRRGQLDGLPEVKQAVVALDAGKCLVIFPEGYLRRKEEQLLRRFGQGVWQILRERPNTPVFAGWIEGGWGSYCSYFNGKPTQNKKMDRRRPIRVAVSAGELVPAAVLADHLATRQHLMNRVLEARESLGLPAAERVVLRGGDDEEFKGEDQRE
jgi:1-acyl-sn-glycerol-3-phosphate acyltransferase